jgi:hypothetical protein
VLITDLKQKSVKSIEIINEHIENVSKQLSGWMRTVIN